MKELNLWVFGIILSALAFSSVAQDEEDCYQYNHVFVTGTMNIREDATTRSAIIDRASSGSDHAVLSSVQGHLYCWMELIDGWMAVTAYTVHEIPIVLPTIIGDDKFQDTIENAYRILEEAETRIDWYVYVNGKIDTIRYSPDIGTGWSGEKLHAEIFVASRLLKFNPTFIARSTDLMIAVTIVHEACHVEQWNSGKRATIWDIEGQWNLEKECYFMQARALSQISPGHPKVRIFRCYGRNYPFAFGC